MQSRSGNPARGLVAFARFAIGTMMLLLGFTLTPSFAAAANTLETETPPPDAIELSVDGVHWSNPLEVSPFDDSLIWVPGDSQVGSVWVRTTCEAASGVAVWELEPDNPPVWADDLLVRTRAGSGEWDQSTAFSDCQAITEFTVSAGEPVRLDLEITFPYGDATSVSVNDTQLRIVDIDSAVVTLSCDGITTTRPALRQCEPPIVDPEPGENGGDNGNGGTANGSGNIVDQNHTNSTTATEPTNSASGILAYRTQQAQSPMSRTGVEALTTLLAVTLLGATGFWLVVHAKGIRARWRNG